jgi:5-methylcytosine-specific restriction endonuclease McrA
MTHVESTRTLLLARGYEPVQIISWQRAITLLALAKVEVVHAYDAEIRAPSLVIRVPAVVRLLRAFPRHARPVRFSRVHIYARDGHRCQYCAAVCSIAELTYDHVVPRAQGGKTTWENIVSACYACNRRKANRTPAQAGMPLRKPPVRPTWIPAVQIRVSARSVPEAWRDYVYWTGEIDHERAAGIEGAGGAGGHDPASRRGAPGGSAGPAPPRASVAGAERVGRT